MDVTVSVKLILLNEQGWAYYDDDYDAYYTEHQLNLLMTLPPNSHTCRFIAILLIITQPGSESSTERKFQEAKVLGTFGPGSESSREHKFLGAKVLGTFAPGTESSIPWYFRSRERKFLGAKVPVTASSVQYIKTICCIDDRLSCDNDREIKYTNNKYNQIKTVK